MPLSDGARVRCSLSRHNRGSRGPRLFINVETHRCSSSSRSAQTSSSSCSNNGDPPTCAVIGPRRQRAQTTRARSRGALEMMQPWDSPGAVVERHLTDGTSYCTARQIPTGGCCENIPLFCLRDYCSLWDTKRHFVTFLSRVLSAVWLWMGRVGHWCNVYCFLVCFVL